jgi:hypothetical protein
VAIQPKCRAAPVGLLSKSAATAPAKSLLAFSFPASVQQRARTPVLRPKILHHGHQIVNADPSSCGLNDA